MTFTDFIYRAFTEAIFPGISIILSFFPMIALTVFIISILHNIGIINKTLAPFVIGFSCSVPAILSCSTISDKRNRVLTSLLVPYMSCSAKLPVYILLSSAFFPGCTFFVILIIYFIGILLAVFFFNIAKSTASCCPSSSSFSVIDELKNCCKSFAVKAFTIIPLSSFIIWVLMNLDPHFSFTSDIDRSILAYISRIAAPIFIPLGFGDWRAVAALFTGLSAKETIVSTLTVIAGTSQQSALCMTLEDIFTPASCCSFMTFCLLYPPCVAALAALKNISGKKWSGILIASGQTALAWISSFIVFNLVESFF